MNEWICCRWITIDTREVYTECVMLNCSRVVSKFKVKCWTSQVSDWKQNYYNRTWLYTHIGEPLFANQRVVKSVELHMKVYLIIAIARFHVKYVKIRNLIIHLEKCILRYLFIIKRNEGSWLKNLSTDWLNAYSEPGPDHHIENQ